MKISVVSGGFDPLHSGHLDYFNEAKKISDYLIVLLNSDQWLKNKKGKPFMPFSERKIIIENLQMVDRVLDFEDDQEGSCSEGLKKIQNLYPNDEIFFCNGGDRNKKNIPEEKISNISFIFNVGGSSKKNSSSWLIKDYFNNYDERKWGKFYDLFKDESVRVKELIVYPKQELSYQRHKYRNEVWFITKGKCKIKVSSNNDAKKVDAKTYDKNSLIRISANTWHQVINSFNESCHIIEIQYGEKTVEDDIERMLVSK